jgi:signal transduction histidine kinase
MADSLRPFYRWGWAPLVAGCAAITGVVAGAELVLSLLGLIPGHGFPLWLLGTRALLTTGLLGLWAGWYVLHSRRRIEGVVAQLRAQQVALAEQQWRAEQAMGLAALSRVLAHEVRGPLHSMALHCVMLRRVAARLPEEARPRVEHLVEMLDSETARVDELLDSYMAYGKDAVPAGLHRQPVDVRALVRAVVHAHRTALDARNVAVELGLAEDLPPVPADPERLERALDHLMRHALGLVSPGGRIHVRVRQAGADVELAVTDSGPGLADPASVFRPFYSSKAGGAELGLAIVRDVARAHGGEVSASNVPGQGSRITVRLPLERR